MLALCSPVLSPQFTNLMTECVWLFLEESSHSVGKAFSLLIL